MRRVVLALSASLLSATTQADERAIREVLEPLLSGARIESIRPSPIPGLLELHIQTETGLRILYSDPQGNHVIHGNIFEPRSGRDLTEERLRQLSHIPFGSLPFGQAVKIQRGKGRRAIAVFSDPYCPACKQFENTLQQLDDVTIHIFIIPVIRPELAEHSKAVWCSSDRPRAWLDLVLRGRRPAAGAACDDPIEKNLELARRLRIVATPTVIFANGERHDGGLPLAHLAQRLALAARPGSAR